MKNKLIRLICLMLVLVFSFSLLVACKDDDDSDDNPNGPVDGTGEARFEGVNFGGTKITLMMSKNQDTGRVGASVAKYMTGLEDNGQENDNDVILKAVNDRNKYVKGKLGLEVDYTYTEAGWDTITDVIKTKFDANDGITDAVALDLFGVVPCMMQGIFKNVNSTDKTNYFDFTDDCWYDATMQSLSLGADMATGKMYILASDYFIDILRCVNIIMVNEDVLAKHFSDINDFYTEVKDGEWTWDRLNGLVDSAYNETANSPIGKDESDEIGIVYQGTQSGSNSKLAGGIAMAITHSADINYIENVGGQLQYFSNKGALQNLADKAKNLVENDGSFGVSDVSEVRTVFANGKALFATNLRLYDLENALLSNMKKSPLPFPKVDTSEEYKAYVHDNASVGAIFKNTRRFTEVSAYWQYCSIKSEATRTAYYDKGLGIKYDTSGSGSNNMAMLNILHDKMTIDIYMWDRYITDSNKAENIRGLFSMLSTYANGGEGIETQWASYGNLKVNGLASIKSTYDALS